MAVSLDVREPPSLGETQQARFRCGHCTRAGEDVKVSIMRRALKCVRLGAPQLGSSRGPTLGPPRLNLLSGRDGIGLREIKIGARNGCFRSGRCVGGGGGGGGGLLSA